MTRRIVTILGFAFVLAATCSLLAYRMVVARTAAASPVAGVQVVAASGDVKLGTVLTAANLKTVQIVGSLPKGAILKPAGALGRGVVSDLYDGEPILESRLAPPGSGGGLASTIPEGMRACAVKVDDVVGVAGFVTPGMRVDVLVSGIPPGGQGPAINQGTVTRTILQNIQVLSAGTDIQKDADGKAKPVQVVNLLVTPEEAEKLSLASNVKIQLVLRNPLDTKVGTIPGTAMGALFSGDAPAPVKVHTVAVAKPVVKAAPHTFSIEVINGSTRNQEKFASPEEVK